MILQRRHLFGAGVSALAVGAAAWPVKSLLDLGGEPLKGPQTPTAAEIAEAEAPMAMMATTEDAPPPRRGLADVRRAFLHNVHTGEMLNVVYFANGRYIAGALAEAKHVLRDWRNNQQHFIHPHLFDVLHDLRAKLGSSAPFQILSGYRSPATNALLHARSEQVASRSQHLLGKALDINMPGVDLSRLHRAAVSLRAGGVGFYPDSGFVHVDVGPVRQWQGA
jgi:uncharacterized protein YcbK (DUF882 family)